MRTPIELDGAPILREIGEARGIKLTWLRALARPRSGD